MQNRYKSMEIFTVFLDIGLMKGCPEKINLACGRLFGSRAIYKGLRVLNSRIYDSEPKTRNPVNLKIS